MGWSFGSRIASFRLLLEGDQFVFNSCEAFIEFLQSAEAVEDGLAECINVVLEEGDGGFNGLQP